MVEELDILDENGNLTGANEDRSIVHSSGLWHRTVHIYFFKISNSTLELLVHLRAKTKDLHPDKWDRKFGGHVKAGETANSAAVTETFEETGLRIDAKNLIQGPTYKKQNFPNNEFVTVYFYQFTGDIHDLSFKDGEVQEVKWMKTEDILQSMENNPSLWSGSKKSFLLILEELNKHI